VFGKTLVCEKLDQAGAAMRRYNLTVITMDGDKVDRKGSLTGGFHDTRRSRLVAIEQLKKWKAALDTDTVRHAEVRKTMARLDQEITRLMGQIHIAETKLKQSQAARDPILIEATEIRKDEERLQSRLSRLETVQNQQEIDLRNMKVQMEGLSTEISTTMTQTLSDEELDMVNTLAKVVRKSKSELADLSAQCSEVREHCFLNSCLD